MGNGDNNLLGGQTKAIISESKKMNRKLVSGTRLVITDLVHAGQNRTKLKPTKKRGLTDIIFA
jgi:hypothetical protein